MAKRGSVTPLVDGILDLLMLGGITAATVVAPNLLQVLGPLFLKHKGQTLAKREVQKTLRYMKRSKVISIVEHDGLFTVEITKKGKKRLLKHRFENLEIAYPKRWDEKWRLVMFDIPMKYDASRREISSKLRELGFHLMQKSVWVHPFPCQDLISVVLEVYPEVKPFLVYAEVNELTNHNSLIHDFKHILS
jgi:DNA-binding transcriptional regulator PaaX